MQQLIDTMEKARALVQSMKQTQLFRRQFDFTRQFTIVAGQKGADEVPLPTEGSYEQIGYNIEHTTQSDGSAPAKIRFKSQGDGQGQSNDFLPLRSISTPGAIVAGTPGVRYGYRPFWRFFERADRLTIEWDGSALSTDITVQIVFTGYLYTGL